MSTEKLYYVNSHLHEFFANVISCAPSPKYEGQYQVILDKTAFFPEGGGQLADTGTIGASRVTDVHEKDGIVVHYVNLSLEPGLEYHCSLDWEQRWRRMQNHSGEHIFSGLVHRNFGFENVGFHMGPAFMTLDFSGELREEDICFLEKRANEKVRDDIPVKTFFPTVQEQETLSYRSKKEILSDLRLVEIPGVDLCACCAPHVSSTGEVGLVKVLDNMRHRGGTRLFLVCGMDAFEYSREMQSSVTGVSRLLSAKREEIVHAVSKLLSDKETAKEKHSRLAMEYVKLRAESIPANEGNIILFESCLDEPAQRELVNLLSVKCEGFAAVFCGEDGAPYRYIIGSEHTDLRALAPLINEKVSGKGGGKSSMISGRALADRSVIVKALEDLI